MARVSERSSNWVVNGRERIYGRCWSADRERSGWAVPPAAASIRNGQFSNPFQREKGYTETGVFVLGTLPGGELLAGGRDQILKYDGKSWTAVRDGLDRVRQLTTTRDGALWVASASGVHRLKDGNWISQQSEEGLPSVMCLHRLSGQPGTIVGGNHDAEWPSIIRKQTWMLPGRFWTWRPICAKCRPRVRRESRSAESTSGARHPPIACCFRIVSMEESGRRSRKATWRRTIACLPGRTVSRSARWIATAISIGPASRWSSRYRCPGTEISDS